MARYRVVIKSSASKEIERCRTKKDRQRIVFWIRSLGENPRPFGFEKLSGHLDRYRVREGSYRIVTPLTINNLLVERRESRPQKRSLPLDDITTRIDH